MRRERFTLAGCWSVYWYTDHHIGFEIARGLDISTLQPSELLPQYEIDAATLLTRHAVNAQRHAMPQGCACSAA